MLQLCLYQLSFCGAIFASSNYVDSFEDIISVYPRRNGKQFCLKIAGSNLFLCSALKNGRFRRKRHYYSPVPRERANYVYFDEISGRVLSLE